MREFLLLHSKELHCLKHLPWFPLPAHTRCVMWNNYSAAVHRCQIHLEIVALDVKEAFFSAGLQRCFNKLTCTGNLQRGNICSISQTCKSLICFHRASLGTNVLWKALWEMQDRLRRVSPSALPAQGRLPPRRCFSLLAVCIPTCGYHAIPGPNYPAPSLIVSQSKSFLLSKASLLPPGTGDALCLRPS